MKKGYGLFEIVIVVLIALILCIFYFKSGSKVPPEFDSNNYEHIQNQQQAIDERIQEIQDIKDRQSENLKNVQEEY